MQDRILFLLKLDARNLFYRIKNRQLEYLNIFSAKRSRDHLGEIFKSRYDQVAIGDLKLCTLEIIRALDDFYNLVDEIKWFLYHTNEMPSAIEIRMQRFVRQLELYLTACENAIDQELGQDGSSISEVESLTTSTIEVALPEFNPASSMRPELPEGPSDDPSENGEGSNP